MSQVIDWLWLIIIGGYFLISTFFLCFPNILHKRKHFNYNLFNQILSSNKVLCVGHRGAGYQAPENTIEGFQYAQKYCDVLQIDACGTKDGEVVINHDENILRTTGVDKLISQINYSQLPTLQEQYIPYCADFLLKTTRNKIPLLQDILKKYPKMPMIIELKTPILPVAGEHKSQDWPIQQLHRLIKKYDREDITIWGSQLDENNSKMFSTNPNLLNWYSEPEIKKIIVFFLLGILPFVCLRQGCILFPLVSNVLRKQLEPQSKCMRCLKMAFYHFLNFLIRLFSSHLQKRGNIIMFFTVNEQVEFQSAVSIGCNAIISDRPSKLKAYLKSVDLSLDNDNENSHAHLLK